MKRREEIKTPLGQAAWLYYQQWMKFQNKMPPPASTFMESRYYRTFINFAKHVQAIGLPKTDKFIRLMKDKDIPPTIWTNDEVYSLYIEFLDRNTTPIEQAKLSVETLLTIAENNEIDVKDVFEKLTPNDIIHLLRQRRLSPWLLLCSKKFKDLVRNKASDEQRIILETFIRPDHWAERVENSAKDVENIKLLVHELNV